jgi:hypothetical protein
MALRGPYNPALTIRNEDRVPLNPANQGAGYL